MTTERKQAIAQVAAPQETWWFKELQEFWEASPDAITAAIKTALDYIRAPHAPAPVQAAPTEPPTSASREQEPS